MSTSGNSANNAQRTQRRRGDCGAFSDSEDLSTGRSGCSRGGCSGRSRGGRAGSSLGVSRLAAGAAAGPGRREMMVAWADMQASPNAEWTWH